MSTAMSRYASVHEGQERALDLQAHGLSYREIGKVLGVSPSTAWGLVNPERARAQRRKYRAKHIQARRAYDQARYHRLRQTRSAPYYRFLSERRVRAGLTQSSEMLGRYVTVTMPEGDEPSGYVEGVSDDGRIVYVSVEGESGLSRFSPDEVKAV